MLDPFLRYFTFYQTKIENGHVKVIASKKLLADGKRRKPMCKYSPSSQHGPVVIVGGGKTVIFVNLLYQNLKAYLPFKARLRYLVLRL